MNNKTKENKMKKLTGVIAGMAIVTMVFASNAGAEEVKTVTVEKEIAKAENAICCLMKEMNPQDVKKMAVSLCMVAEEYQKEGMYEDAQMYFETSLQVCPNYERAEKGLVKVAKALDAGHDTHLASAE